MSKLKNFIRRMAGLGPSKPAPRDSRPDNMVFTGGYQPKPGGKLGSPPTGGSAVRDRTYNDPLTDMVTMGIILSSASDAA